ncbi:MAG: SPASM domain-containing protein, partial [Candidatus Nitrosocosmicus sp.]|nr:SPASM domain-containing protein [Candidatus Nitrosocosmicus sp.]
YMERSEHSKFINKVFDKWYEMDDVDFQIREFSSIIRALLGGKHISCLLAGNCIGKYYGVNYNGDIYHCDEFMTDSNYKLGNILTHNFNEILVSENAQHLKETNNQEIHFLNCKWKDICNGGCPKDRYVHKLMSKKEIECCGYSDLIEHIYDRIQDSIKNKSIN